MLRRVALRLSALLPSGSSNGRSGGAGGERELVWRTRGVALVGESETLESHDVRECREKARLYECNNESRGHFYLLIFECKEHKQNNKCLVLIA